MLINQKSNAQTNESSLFTEGVFCINSSQWLLAYGIFKELTAKNPSVATLYNMALCYFFAKDHVKTIYNLNEALQKTAIPSGLSNQATALPEALLVHEYQNNSYLFALTETTLSLNNSLVKLRIRRLLVDANLQLENWQEVIRLSCLPEMDKCKNVLEAINIAKTKINN